MKKFIVYMHECTLNGKRYVGYTSKTMEFRWKGHVANAKNDSKVFYFQRAIRKYGELAWRHIILEIFETKEEALNAEIKWIKALETTNPRYGYNSTMGGQDGAPSDEVRKKISDAVTKAMTPEVRAKISKSNLGKRKQPMSEETKKKLSIAHTGKIGNRLGCHHTVETKAKISAKSKNRPPVSAETRKKISDVNKRRWKLWRAQKQLNVQ